jgi:hypothetical protein
MIAFENKKTGETVQFTADQDPASRQAHIAAYLNSSDMSPNALKGQDFGWRLSPEIVVEMERIRTDITVLDLLARRIGISIDDIRDFHILNYIAEQTFAAETLALKKAENSAQHEQSYNARLARVEGELPAKPTQLPAEENTTVGKNRTKK